MKNRITLLLAAFAALVLSHCCATEAGRTLGALAEKGAHRLAEHYLGPFAGPAPTGAGCDDQNPAPDPDEEPAALTSHQAAMCTQPVTGHGDCPLCTTSDCCNEIVACLSEGGCTCNLAKRTPGIDWPADVACDAPDDTFKTAIACLSAHCAAECPRSP